MNIRNLDPITSLLTLIITLQHHLLLSDSEIVSGYVYPSFFIEEFNFENLLFDSF